jgi:hypothetical protein
MPPSLSVRSYASYLLPIQVFALAAWSLGCGGGEPRLDEWAALEEHCGPGQQPRESTTADVVDFAVIAEQFAADLKEHLGASGVRHSITEDAGNGYRIIGIAYGSIASSDSVVVSRLVNSALRVARQRLPQVADCSTFLFHGGSKETVNLACLHDPTPGAAREAASAVEALKREFVSSREPHDQLFGEVCAHSGECAGHGECIGAAELANQCDGARCCVATCHDSAFCERVVPGSTCVLKPQAWVLRDSSTPSGRCILDVTSPSPPS